MDGSIPTSSIVTIPLAQLRVWADNPRKRIGDLTGLTASILARGIDSALIVRPVVPPAGDITHEVIAGQRRYLAATAAGSLGVPCVVRDLTDAEALDLAFVENDQRDPMDPLDEAEALHRRLHDEKDPVTVDQLADRIGREKRYVLRRLSLRGLCDAAKAWMRDGALPLRHAELLAATDPATQATTCARYKGREIPPYKAFARDLSLALTVLGNAPFDVKDARLVPDAGACGVCPKNSAAQPDLFGGVSEDAHCCNRPCWDAKVEAHWQREQRAAKRKGLAVVEDVIDYGTVTRRDVPYVSAEMLSKGHEQPQTAITRSEFGHVIALYDRPAKPAKERAPKPPAEVADAPPDAGDGDAMDGGAFTGPADVDDTSADDAETPAAAPRPSKRARERARLAAIAQVAGTPAGAILTARVALFNAVSEWGDHEFTHILNALDCRTLAGDLATDVAAIPDELVVRVLVTYLATSVLTAAHDDTPAFEHELRALLDAPAEEPQRERIGGHGFAERDYPRTVCETCKGDEVSGCICEAPAPVADDAFAAIVIPDDCDWLKLSKGLTAFNAEKTPGGGSVSGGSCRPLRLVKTPATEQTRGDRAKLLDRLEAAGVPCLGLGEVSRAAVFDLAPSNRTVRERWNAMFLTRPVTLGDGEPGWAPVVASALAADGFTPKCVWIKEKVWDGLTPDQQGLLSTPDVAVEEVVWEGRVGYVVATVRDAKTLAALQHVLREHRVKHSVLFEGEKVETAKSSKKKGAAK